MALTVRDNPAESRYEIFDDGQLAGYTQYHLYGGIAAFIHTEIADGFGGRGLATDLIREALEDVRKRGLRVQPFCPFVRQFIARHPDLRDLVPREEWARFELEDPAGPW